MKKSITLLIVGLLFISGIGAATFTKTTTTDQLQIESTSLSISEPVITEKEEFVSVELKQATSYLMDAGKPMLPIIGKTFVYPAGTKLGDITVNFEKETIELEKKISPAPQKLPLNPDIAEQMYVENPLDLTVYESSNLYPSESYDINTGAGRYNGEHVLFVTVNTYTQYAPSEDALYVPSEISIDVSFDTPASPLFAADEYDLLIITDEKFVSDMQRLVDHKNSIGIKTVMETVQDIYPAYNGRDDPEDIKLRIKDAIEEWGIKYVLLAGGRKGQTHEWYVPSRTTNNDDGWEAGYESDLYYSDIYKTVDEDDYVFEDWDSNENDVFAEWSNFVNGKDEMDFFPDVSVGRLPIRYTSEAAVVVDKIIDYETNADDSWFKNGIVVSGDTFPPSRGGSPGWWEGEMGTGHTVDYLESDGFDMKKLWLSIPGAWTGPQDVINAINAGAGFVHFAGHSNPASWGNHPPDDTEHEFIDGIRIWDMNKLTNTGEYPIVMLGGCHSAQFNVTMANIISGIMEYGLMGYFFTSPMRFYYFEWVPHDLSSWFVIQKDGGAIASMGNTGLGYGYVNSMADAGLGGWLDPRFFDNYVNESLDDEVRNYLGPLHDSSIADYIKIIGNVNEDQIDRKTIEEHVLLGDPSLRIGGV